MTAGRKMAAIRRELGICQTELAHKMHMDPIIVDDYENDKCPVSDSILDAFREATDMNGVPLQESEVSAIELDLYDWADLIVVNRMECANERYDNLAHIVKWSFDAGLQNWFDVFCIMYYHALGEMDECAKITDAVQERKYELTPRQLCIYWCILGAQEYNKCKYKSAVRFYLKAIDAGGASGIHIRQLHHDVGTCLTHMGYSNLAIEHLEKSRSNDLNASIIKHGSLTQKLLAICHSRLGRVDKALQLLDDYRQYIFAENKSGQTELSSLYLNHAMVYEDSGNYEQAQESYDWAFMWHSTKDEIYLLYTCYKAMFLRNSNKTKATHECIDECLPFAVKGTLWHEWLIAIKHSLTLDNKASEDYLLQTSIPRLMEYGIYRDVMKFYTWLSDHHRASGNYETALQYSDEAHIIHVKLSKGDLSL